MVFIIGFVWVILTLIFDWIIMPITTGHGREKEVPDLFEMEFSQAQTTAKKLGFKVIKSETRYDSFYPAGVVIEQAPPPFTLSKIGRKIKVVISEGEQVFPMPEVIGLQLKEAEFKLDEKGFKVPHDRISLLFSNIYPDGVVAEQPFVPGTMMPRGTAISLTVSMGKMPKTFKVPELYTFTLKDAVEMLTRAGLQVGDTILVKHEFADSGVVVDQSLPPDTKVKYLDKIDLRVSIGKDKEKK